MVRNKSTGVLHYSPKSNNKWWLVLWCDNELSRYYRHLYHLYCYKCDSLKKPAWNSHITVIRDEMPSEISLWGLYQDISVDFYYECDFETDGTYWWIPVISDQLMEIRCELGLSQPQFPFHISFGIR